ncbi:MAG: IPT/TIG domain-containing protein [Acidobacteria bacterium]|nr:IPT/TIG domain-containing protein [Acidobacteriota bacterium]MBV9474750.1 IPT/TIG domain-containing protein [Acidobacteriota bacterium]
MKRFAAWFAVLLCFVVGTTAFAEEDRGMVSLLHPVVMDDDIEVPGCDAVLTQTMVAAVRSMTVDPLVTFEEWRTAHRSMMEASPVIECQSRLWRELAHAEGLGNTASVPEGTKGLSLRPSPGDLTFQSFAASIGSNVNPNNGVENYQGEMQISVNPNNPMQLIAGANSFYRDPSATCQAPAGSSVTFGTQALYGSSDGGVTWTYRCAPWHPSVTAGVTGANAYFGSDPAMAWDNQGRAYAVYMLLSQNGTGTLAGASIVIARSTDVGNTWTPLGVIVNRINISTALDDKEMVAIDNSAGPASVKSHPGRIYVVWDEGNIERVAYSDDGAAWTTVVLPTAPVGDGDIGGNVVVGADGTVYVVWNSLIFPGAVQTGEMTFFSKSEDGGDSWSDPVAVATQSLLSFGGNNKPPAQESRGLNAFGSIGIDNNPNSPYFGYLYVAYPDFPSGSTTGTNINVYVVTSSNGGTSWSTPVRVNDDGGNATQFFPWLSVDQSDGTVHVSWYDTRVDPTNNRRTQLFYARSSNGGITFEPNMLVTDNGGVVWRNLINYSDENTSDNATRNANQYGDYSGIVAANRQVHPFWMDSRSFFPLADTVSPTRREDAASSTLVFCTAPTTVAVPAVTNTCGIAGTQVNWSVPGAWGTNATGGTYSIYRSTTSTFPGGTPLASNVVGTSYFDTTGVAGTTYYYFVEAKNNCPGTALTAMTTVSAASAPIVFNASGGSCGILQGVVSSAGVPLSGVLVTAGAYTASTDASGFYQIVGLPSSTYTVTAALAGYTTGSASGVVVSDATTTVQNFNLAATTSSACLTDTTQNDLGGGSYTASLDLVSSPGDVKLLANPPVVDQQQSTASNSGRAVTNTTWAGQSFVPGVTANLVSMDLRMFYSSGTAGAITVEIRNNNAGVPGTTVLGSATLPSFTTASSTLLTANFSPGVALTAGTTYHIVVRQASSGTYGIIAACASSPGCNPYASGNAETGTGSGTTWTAVNTDLFFVTYMLGAPSYQLSGNLVSTLKDTNPVLGATPAWTTLSWTATTPANTAVKFQVAGSNNPGGPFNFVGPDGTASTFFTTSGASLSQFNGLRYLKYKAYLSTTDVNATPILSDVTVCYQLNDCSTTTPPSVTPASAQVCSSSTGNTADGPAGATSYAWAIANGTITGGATSQTVTYTAGASGNVHLTLTTTVASGCEAATSVDVPILVVATPSITGGTAFCTGTTTTLTSSSATGNQWYLEGTAIVGATNQTYAAGTAGSYTVQVTSSGCLSAMSNPQIVTENPLPATPTATPDGPTSYCTGGSVTLTSSSATGNQWRLNGSDIVGATNNTYVVTTQGGAYTVVVTDGNSCASNPSAAVNVTVNPIPSTPTATPDGPTTYCTGGSVTLTSSSATGNQWRLNGSDIVGATNNTYVVTTQGGAYTVVVSNGSCASSPSSAVNVTVNPLPATPTATPDGPTTYCTGGSVTLTSNSPTGNQWRLNGSDIVGATNNTYVVTTQGGAYTVVVTDGNSCASNPSAAVTVTVNPVPATPTATPDGPTTYCAGGSVTLTSSSATGNQWRLNGSDISGATSNTYVVTSQGGAYTVVVTNGSCASSPSAAVNVTVNPLPNTPTITPGGATTFCTGGSVTLTSNSATGNQWRLNGSDITGATGNTYIASQSGDYTVVVTDGNNCPSNASATVTVTVNMNPDATITAPGSIAAAAAGSASVPDAGLGASYAWTITNGTINGSNSGRTVNFTAGAAGTMTLGVTVTSGSNCSANSSANVTVTAVASTVTVTNVSPNTGTHNGGSPVTITGTGFASGATVTFGGTAATSVVVVNATTITAVTPAHAVGSVTVTVTNTDTSTGSLSNAFTYVLQQFDANGDNSIDPSDIFYLVNYLFDGGLPPRGAAGMLSGDANGDGVVDPADIFYVVNYLFLGGPQPMSTPSNPRVSTSASHETLAGGIRLGAPVVREGRTFVPVIVTSAPGSTIEPLAIALKLRLEGAGNIVAVRRTAAVSAQSPIFEVSRPTADGTAYLLALDGRNGSLLTGAGRGVVAEIELAGATGGRLSIDANLSMLSDLGAHKATVAAGTLEIHGTELAGNNGGRRPASPQVQ